MNKFIHIIIFLLLIFLSNAVFAETLTDQAGFTLKKPEKLEKLVIVFPQSFGLACILGLGKNIVGFPLHRIGLQQQNESIFMHNVAPGVYTAKDVGNPGQPNIETILSLKPDLVLSAIHVPTSQKMNELLRNNGISVLGLKAGFGSINNWLEAVELTGKASNKSEQALKYIDMFHKNLNFVKNRIATITNKPKVLVINSGDGQTTIRGSRTKFVFELVEAAGGQTIEQIEKTDTTSNNMETILKFDPDIVITDGLDHMKNWEWWSQLRATKNNKVFIAPIDDPAVIMTGWVNTMYAPLAVLWIAKCIHPEIFADVDIEKEHDKFCSEIFGVTFAK